MIDADELIECRQAIGRDAPEHDPSAGGGKLVEFLGVLLQCLQVGGSAVDDRQAIARGIQCGGDLVDRCGKQVSLLQHRPARGCRVHHDRRGRPRAAAASGAGKTWKNERERREKTQKSDSLHVISWPPDPRWIFARARRLRCRAPSIASLIRASSCPHSTSICIPLALSAARR